ncbi:MAG TPA: amidase [Verrucomicrobiae bacterium]|nr:amidase [Verrucomicrobiae bacterium]
MDRRTWCQLLGVLAAARPAFPQTTQPPATNPQVPAGRGQGRAQNPPRITKDQLKAALVLIGLEFQDAELDMMLRNVDGALASYESLRGLGIPYDTEPSFAFHPGLPNRVPIKGPQRFATTIPTTSAVKAPSSLEDLAFWRVTELAPLIRSRAVSSTDLTKMYLARMKKYSPKLLCLVTLTEDLALAQAAAADQEIKAGRYRGPLHGIPFGVKDLFDTKDIPTTWGAEPFMKRVPPYDATVIERLRKAGAVLIAKLSMGALAQGDLWFQGRTKNPWSWDEKTSDYTQGSSGSSAGSASSTSAGLVGFSLGTETLGSIVSPSGVCGVTGLRPTYGRISRHGAMALSWTMDKIGPICRGVEDCAIVLNAVYGPDGHDRSVGADPFHWEPRKPLKSLRVGVYQKGFDATPRGGGRGNNPQFQQQAEERKKVYAQALDDLKKAGVSMTEVDYDENLPSIRFLLEAEGAAAFDDITRDGEVRALKGQGAGDWPNTFRSARLIPAVEYIRAQRARTEVIERFERFMENWDVVVIPPQSFLTTTNLTGNPEIVTKCGFVNHRPVEIGFLGRIYDEGSPLRVALAYEQATEWHKNNPPSLGV